MTTALLIIDVQQGLFDEQPRPFEADAVITRINIASAKARAAKVPVIHIQHERASGRLAHGSASWQLAGGLDTAPADHFVRKTTPDSFLRTQLADLLTTLNASHLVICGYASEFCVDTTTRRAAALGFSVTLLADAHTTHDKDHASGEQIRAHHNATLPCLTSFGPAIVTITVDELTF